MFFGVLSVLWVVDVSKKGSFMVHCFDVGSFIYHPVYGYGEITTVTDNGKEVFVDFRKGHYGWFPVKLIKNSPKIYNVDKAFIRVQFKDGDNLKDIIDKYSGLGYRYVDILF